MMIADVIYLITPETSRHGVFDTVTETERMVYCTVRSVYRDEFYQAKEQGITPIYVFELSDYADYEGERIVKYNGTRYEVIRTYVDGLKCEITVQEAKSNVG